MTALGRLALVLSVMAVVTGACMWLGYQSRDLRYNVQNYVESQQSTQIPF